MLREIRAPKEIQASGEKRAPREKRNQDKKECHGENVIETILLVVLTQKSKELVNFYTQRKAI